MLILYATTLSLHCTSRNKTQRELFVTFQDFCYHRTEFIGSSNSWLFTSALYTQRYRCKKNVERIACQHFRRGTKEDALNWSKDLFVFLVCVIKCSDSVLKKQNQLVYNKFQVMPECSFILFYLNFSLVHPRSSFVLVRCSEVRLICGIAVYKGREGNPLCKRLLCGIFAIRHEGR